MQVFLNLIQNAAHAIELGRASENLIRLKTSMNGDGYVDLVTHHRTSETGILKGDSQSCLSGLVGITYFEICDTISTVPSRKK